MYETLEIFIKNEYLKLMGLVLLGVALGYVLQRSRFCLASAFSDFIVFKDGTLLKAVLVFILISSIGFSFIQLQGKEGYIIAIGWRTIVGGLLFGAGMALAGGCAVGTLMRIGEGYLLFLPALLGLVLGGALGAYHYNYWGSPEGLDNIVFLPGLLGWVPALATLIIILLILWLALEFLTSRSGDE